MDLYGSMSPINLRCIIPTAEATRTAAITPNTTYEVAFKIPVKSNEVPVAIELTIMTKKAPGFGAFNILKIIKPNKLMTLMVMGIIHGTKVDTAPKKNPSMIQIPTLEIRLSELLTT